MLAFVLSWLILAAVCVPPGLGLLRLLGAGCFGRPADRFALSAWLGLALLSGAALGLSLFARLSPWAGAALGLLLAAPPLVVSKGVRAELAGFARLLTPGVAGGLAALVLGAAALTSQQVWNFDTGLYHYGFIKWLSEFGAVHGVALVHYRFAVATSWYAVAAFFDEGPLAGRMSAVLGGFTLLLMLLHLAAALARWAAGRAGAADRLLALASGLCAALVVYGMMPKPAFWQAAVSPSPDFPVNVLIILIAWSIVLILESGERPEGGRLLDASLVPLILAAGALTIRVSALPLVAVAGLFYAFGGAAVVRRFLVGGAVVAPFFAVVAGYQFVASGCPLFPVPLCADVPWSVGAGQARLFVVAVRDYGRWLGAEHDSADHFGWIGPWFVMGLTRADLWLLAGSAAATAAAALLCMSGRGGRLARRAAWACGLLFVGLLAFRAQNVFMLAVTLASILGAFHVVRRVKGGAWLLALGLAGSFLTLYSGPSVRFALGYLTVLLACLALLSKPFAEGTPRLPPRLEARTIFAALLLAFGVAVNAERAARSAVNFASARLGRTSAASPAQPEGTRAAVAKPAPTTGPAPNTELASATRPAPAEAEETVAPAPGPGVFRSRLIVPPHIFPGVVVRRRAGNFEYFMAARYEQCWAAELPCAPVELPPGVALRDPSRGLSVGFVDTGR